MLSNESRFTRRLRVITEPKHSNRMHRTRTLSELILLSPRSSLRINPRLKRFDMDIEVSQTFAQREGSMNLIEAPYTLPDSQASIGCIIQPQSESSNQILESDSQLETPTPDPHARVSEVVNVLFEIHSALKLRNRRQRTAASALAATNMVSMPLLPEEAIPRDEQMESIENTRKMLECAICQEVFTGATEATCCGQIFCKECIERWVSERGSCPMCRENIGFSLLSASRHTQRMANEMKVACPYCAKVFKKAELTEHVNECEMAPVEPPPPMDVALRSMLLATARLSTFNLGRFLLAPSAPESMVTQCYIRTHGGGTYELFTQDTNTLLCTAIRRRQYDMSVNFSIYLGNCIEPHQSTSPVQIARLEKNYMGSQYIMFSMAGTQSEEIGAVQYAATFGKSPRQMRVALPCVRPVDASEELMDGVPAWELQPWQAAHKDDSILAHVEQPNPSRAIGMINKPPVWIESLEAYCLDFGGRVAAASVKNFLLSHPNDMEKTLMLFGRTQDRQVYSMDYSHPFSPVQAFAIALSSMDSHLVTFD
ncbi:hypothetical protein ABG067_006104 [Albugo candida]